MLQDVAVFPSVLALQNLRGARAQSEAIYYTSEVEETPIASISDSTSHSTSISASFISISASSTSISASSTSISASSTSISPSSTSISPSSMSISPSSMSVSPSSTPTAASGSSSSGSSSNTGAIVGGVVGGVVGLAMIAALFFFMACRHRRRGPAAIATTGPMGGDIPPPTSSFVGQNLTVSAYAPPVHNKVYDPNDRSTFPSAHGVPYGQQQAPGGYLQSYAPLPPSSPDSNMIPNRFSLAQPTSPPPAYCDVPEV